ncbi:MAG: HD domain-containing protein [Proteobacteria bacterium]|nr:HD domain-containing protein [Pseudomonadota bacterium]
MRPSPLVHLVAAALVLGSLRAAAGEPAPPDTAWRAQVKAFAAQHFGNPAWGYSHCERDYSLARSLAQVDHVTLDDDVLFAAAYLHDMAAFPPWADPKIDHADAAAAQVDGVLKNTGFPMAKIDRVRGAIRTHMYPRDPVGPEALYLHDADALDWLGAIGVARVFGLVDPSGGKPTGPQVVPMLEERLANVPARVLSPAGRAQLAQRQEELAAFLRDLRRESDDLSQL